MAWTTPKTWQVDELVTAASMNTQIRDNLNALKVPPSAHYECDETSDYTTTSTTFVDVDAANLSLSITTYGGDVMVHFHGTISASPALFDVAVDGVRAGSDDGIVRSQDGSYQNVIAFTRLIAGLSAGAHTFTLQWRTAGSNTARLYAGAGTSNLDLHPQFWVREVS